MKKIVDPSPVLRDRGDPVADEEDLDAVTGGQIHALDEFALLVKVANTVGIQCKTLDVFLSTSPVGAADHSNFVHLVLPVETFTAYWIWTRNIPSTQTPIVTEMS